MEKTFREKLFLKIVELNRQKLEAAKLSFHSVLMQMGENEHKTDFSFVLFAFRSFPGGHDPTLIIECMKNHHLTFFFPGY